MKRKMLKTVEQILMKTTKSISKLNGKVVKENFGNKEIRELKDFIGTIYDYPYNDRCAIIIIQKCFADWCGNYTGVDK